LTSSLTKDWRRYYGQGDVCTINFDAIVAVDSAT